MKKLFGLLIGLLSCISFGYCFNLSDGQIEYLNNNSISSGENISQGGYIKLYDNGSESNSIIYNYCVVFSGFSRSSDFSWKLNFVSSLGTANGAYYSLGSDYSLACVSGWRRYFLLQAQQASYVFNISKYWVITAEKLFGMFYDTSSCSCPDCSLCENDLLQCESDYLSCSNSLGNCGSSLNSCQISLGNCMQGNIGTGINWSSIYINDIQHLGKPIINITIPEEIDWDYLSTGEVFDLTIDGYNVDTEYIDGIIRTQNYKPTTDDFTKLVGLLAPYTKILVFLLFVFVIWAWIKKPFKSKKL